MTPNLAWNWAPPLPRQSATCEKVLVGLEARLARDAGNELVQLRIVETRVMAGDYAGAAALGMIRPPGMAGEQFASRAWDRPLAIALSSLGRFDEALARIEAVPEHRGDAELSILRMQALLKLGQRSQAAEELTAHRAAPDRYLRGSLLGLAQSLWGPEEVLHRLNARPADVRPGETIDATISCLLALGRAGEASDMFDPKRHICARIMDPPDGWEQSRFLADLRADAAELPGLEPDPPHTTTIGGSQTSRVLGNRPRAIGALMDRICLEVERYWDALADGDWVKDGRPHRPTINVWSVSLQPGGYQMPHLHGPAWLSGVYYASEAESSGHAGALRIGLGPSEQQPQPWPPIHIAPEPGKLVLFPSFLRHDTVPHSGQRPRLSYAFDVFSG